LKINFAVLLVKENYENTLTLEDLNRIIDDRNQENNESAMAKPILDIYKKLIELKDNDLLFFLRASVTTLLKIDEINKYLKVIENTSQTDKREITLHIDSKKQLELLKEGNVTDFNRLVAPGDVIQDVVIHHPFEDLNSLELRNIKLRGAFLFMTRLVDADLTEADLGSADLSNANLSEADLTEADLGSADLSNANLSEADLTKARLSKADLMGANLSEADLSRSILIGANLSMADLSEASLIGANLSKADLTHADLSGANLWMANLSGANLSEADLSQSLMLDNKDYDNLIINNTTFKDAIIINPEFIRYLKTQKAQKIPDEIKNKQDLESRLKRAKFKPNIIDYQSSISKFPLENNQKGVNG
jgi:uncharacterized protein YjbI with pentapeptide repeats